MSWKWVQIVVVEVTRLLCTTRGWWGGVWGGSFPGAGQGGLKEAVKGPRNGISNVSLPLKHGGKKTSALHFSLPCSSFVFQTIWESDSLSRGSYFFGPRGRFAGSAGQTDVGTDGCSLARSLSGLAHVKTTAGHVAKGAQRVHLFAPVHHL